MRQQDPSRFEALKQGVKEKVAIGLISIAGGVAVANQLESEPASAANTPEATGSDLQQDCVDVALAKPRAAYPNLGHAYMNFPGDRRRQSTDTFSKLKPTSVACRQLVTRKTPRVVFKVQNPNNHQRWAKTKPQVLQINDINASGSYRPMEPDEGGIGAAGFSSPGLRFKNKKLLYRCTPGKGVTKAQAVYQMEADSAVDGHILGRKSYTVPVKIHPVRFAVLGGGVKRAC
jgi:hypothetical protein